MPTNNLLAGAGVYENEEDIVKADTIAVFLAEDITAQESIILSAWGGAIAIAQ